jgi:hypothetical protein
VAAGAGLFVVDVTAPAGPAIVGVLPGSDVHRAVHVAGRLAFVAADEGGLRIVDVRDPRAPRALATHPTPSAAVDVAVVGSTAFVAAGGAGLRVIDVSDPTAPEERAANDERFVRRLAVRGRTVFAASEQSGLLVFDASGPGAPRLVETLDTWGSASAVALSGAQVLVADGPGGLLVFGPR